MNRIIFLTTIFFIVIGCSKDEDLLIPTVFNDNPSIMIVMIVFCQASLDDTLKLVEYGYDDNKLVTETTIQNGEIRSKRTFDYNSDNQIISEIYLTDGIKIEKTYAYNENNQLINILYKVTYYHSNGQIRNEYESEAPREYENNQLVKEWVSWGGFNTYEYSDGMVVTKISYTKNGEKHHITTYKYSGNLLTEERKETRLGGLIYLKSFEYDSLNRLTIIRDGENIIEENDYIDNNLTEKRTYYFGVDPGYYVCYGNYLYKYNY